MSAKLNLTDDQKKQLLPALTDFTKTMIAAREKLMQTYSTVLTDQQKALLKEMEHGGHGKAGVRKVQ